MSEIDQKATQIHALYSLDIPRVKLAAALQHLPDRHGGHRGRSPTDPDALGLISAWWGKPLKDFKLATFNARAETVAEMSALPRESGHLSPRRKVCLAIANVRLAYWLTS